MAFRTIKYQQRVSMQCEARAHTRDGVDCPKWIDGILVEIKIDEGFIDGSRVKITPILEDATRGSMLHAPDYLKPGMRQWFVYCPEHREAFRAKPEEVESKK